MNILITGGAGFIGSNLALYLSRQKHEVIALDNLSFGYLENLRIKGKLKPRFVRMDILDPNIGRIMKNIDVIFHLAGITSLSECQNNPRKAYEINVAGTANILEAARRHNIKRIIFSSTSAVYENETTFPTPERSDPKPSLIYSLSKKHAEEMCKTYQKLYGMDIVILRFFNVYGPNMDFQRSNPPLVGYIIKCLLNHEPPILHSDGKQSRDMVYVEDVLKICKIVLTHPNAKNQIFNVGSGKSYTVKEIYQQIVRGFKKKDIKPIFRSSTLIWDNYSDLFKGQYPFNTSYLLDEVNKHTLASVKKAKNTLNWNPGVSLKDGIEKTVQLAIRN